jgi:glutamyl-tRNA synthetase
LSFIDLLKPRVKRLHDFAEEAPYFFTDQVAIDAAAAAKHLEGAEARGLLAALADRIATVEPFASANLDAALRELAAERGVKAGALVHPARVALTGRLVSPGLFEVMELLGRRRTLERLRSVSSPAD